ncbi:MAG: hypothetical protein ACP5O7_09415, partial [Phycisphaerae bacterium]
PDPPSMVDHPASIIANLAREKCHAPPPVTFCLFSKNCAIWCSSPRRGSEATSPHKLKRPDAIPLTSSILSCSRGPQAALPRPFCRIGGFARYLPHW